MGIGEERIEITVSQLYELVKEAARADLFRNGVKNRVPFSYILSILDGEDSALKAPVWHDVKTDPPKTPGQYYGKKDDTNSMWLCNYRDGRWTLVDYMAIPGREMEMKIVQWAEYGEFAPCREEDVYA